MSSLPTLLQQLYTTAASPVTQLHSGLLRRHELSVYLKRDDLLHPEIGGNKWRKLKYNLAEAINHDAKGLATFGGAYSNHIAAVAAAGRKFGLATTGFIRGEEHLPLNPTLRRATQNGMQLIYLDRERYRRKNEPEVQNQLKNSLPENVYFLPEGGSNTLAVKGCAELVAELDIHWDYFCCPAGTGGSMAGIIAGSAGLGTILGFPALKGGQFLYDEIEELQRSFSGATHSNWKLITEYHFGGYAKVKPELLDFINWFREEFRIQLDPVYTGKMMFGIFDLISKNYFPKGSTIIAWHTGGLQGLAGMRERGMQV